MALFVRPLNFSVVSGDATAAGPVSNANIDAAGLVWRTTGANNTVILDLGTAAKYDTIALIGVENAGTTARIQTGTTTATSTYDTANFSITDPVPEGFTRKIIKRLDTVRTQRYVKITLGGTNAITVQRIVIGKALPLTDLAGVDLDAEQSFIDQSTQYAGNGWESYDELPVLMQWKLSVSFIGDVVWRNDWTPFYTAVGKKRAFLFVPDSDDVSSWQAEAIFGRIKNEANTKIQAYDARRSELVIRALAP